jgi:hypothetical protein
MKERLLNPASKCDPKVRAALDLVFRDVIRENNTIQQDCILDKDKSEVEKK